jgi:hypothetical protein
MMMTTFSTPFLLERAMGLTALETGALLVAMQACTTATAAFGGWLYDRSRSPWLSVVSLGMVASGLTLLGALAGTLQYGQCFAIAIWMGIGSGMFMTTNNTAIMGALAADMRGFASGMLETTRQYGHTLGVAIATIGLGAALGPGGAAAGPAGVRDGFGQAALLMGMVGWAGVILASFPPLTQVAARRRGAQSPAGGLRPVLAPAATERL